VRNIPQQPNQAGAFRFVGPGVYRILARVEGTPTHAALMLSAANVGWGPTRWWTPENLLAARPSDWPRDELMIQARELPPTQWIGRMEGVWHAPATDLGGWALSSGGSVTVLQVWRGEPEEEHSFAKSMVTSVVLTTGLGVALMYAMRRAASGRA
jgi:hypothetical protein